MKVHAGPAGHVTDHAVYLNGELLEGVIVADDEAGFVAVKSRDSDGNHIPQGAGAFKVDTRNGRVEIVQIPQTAP